MIKEKSQISAELDERVLLDLQNGRKQLKVVAEPGYFRAKWSNGGRLPKILESKFTSRHKAEETIAVWLAGRKD